jgi:hypothetical protein
MFRVILCQDGLAVGGEALASDLQHRAGRANNAGPDARDGCQRENRNDVTEGATWRLGKAADVDD